MNRIRAKQGQPMAIAAADVIPLSQARANLSELADEVKAGAEKIITVGADPILSHRADRILSQGWKPTLRLSAVDKSMPLGVGLPSMMVV
jgi:hypothetical protein